VKTGLVSITFRNKTPEEIVTLVKKGGLDGIEWGGDVHVPHGDLNTAEQVKKMTLDAGLEIASYGSYYRAAYSETAEQPIKFSEVLKTAIKLNAPTIRVWAGVKGSAASTQEEREAVIADLRRIGSLAAQEGITISLEYHGGTLTDTNESAQQLIKEVNHHNIRLYWQPSNGKDFTYCIEGLKAIINDVSNVHVFHWAFTPDNKIERRPLAEGKAVWMEYLKELKKKSVDRYAMIEFVRNESDQQFLEDAATLRQWIKKEE